eukprot:6867426-Pyramimonas_sp.AAC.1
MAVPSPITHPRNGPKMKPGLQRRSNGHAHDGGVASQGLNALTGNSQLGHFFVRKYVGGRAEFSSGGVA